MKKYKVIMFGHAIFHVEANNIDEAQDEAMLKAENMIFAECVVDDETEVEEDAE
jgi:hypothetical protein